MESKRFLTAPDVKEMLIMSEQTVFEKIGVKYRGRKVEERTAGSCVR